MRERALTFGSHEGLVGIISAPDQAHFTSAPAVLLFNVGLNHHVGPHRLNVELARYLAERGFVALRFDLSGLGDSEPRRDDRSDTERAILDVTEAMDVLQERKGIQSFIVVGLCSGVDPAHAVAVNDSRVKGAVFIDGYAYTTPGYFVREVADHVARIFVPGNYKRWFRRRILPLIARQVTAEGAEALGIFDRTFPPIAQFKNDLETMLARRVQILFLYTRHAYFFNHRGQFARMIGAKSLMCGVELEHQLGADHVFTPVLERARAVRTIANFIERHFGAEVGTSTELPRDRASAMSTTRRA